MKKLIQTSLKSIPVLLCLSLSLLANHAGAQQGWDPSGTTSIGGSGTWDTGSLLWTPNGTQTQVASGSLVAFTPGNTALFCAGPSGSALQGNFTITVNSSINIGGIVNGEDNPGPCQVTINNGGSGALNLTGNTKLTTYSGSVGGYTTINVPITGTGPLVPDGTGVLSLFGVNTYTAGTLLYGGANGAGLCYVNNSASFGASTGTITPSYVNTPGFSAVLASGNSPITIPNPWAISTLNAGVNFVGINTAPITCSGNWTLSNPLHLKNNGVSGGAGAVLTLSGVLSGANGVTLSANNSGTTVFSGANTYTGQTLIGGDSGSSQTTLSVASLNYVTSGTWPTHTASNLGAPSSAANGTIGMGSLTTAGILIYTGAGETTDRVINLAGTTGGATIENDGTGPLSFTSAFTATGSGVKTLTLQGVNAAPSTISAAIVNSASATALTKAQTGTWALSGVNTYTGATTVNGGTLLVNSPGSLASGSAVTVAAGATLGGNGTINGTVSVSAGGIVAPGGANSIGTLTLANSGNALTLNGALLLFDLDDPTTAGTTYDTITIGGTGVLVLNGANYIQFNAPLGSIPNGTYTLMTYSSTSGSGSLVLPNGSTTMTYGASTFTLTVTTTSVTLGVTGGSAPGALTWSGATSTAWNSTDGNWNEGSLTMQDYSDPDSVIFDDTAPANTTTVTGGAVNPGSVNFNNSVNTYSIGANIGGTGTPVWKFGTNTATLTGANTFTGPTTIGAGTLAIASAGDLGDNGSGSGSYAANIANAGTFIYNSSASQTLSGIISGSGSLTQKGSGTLTLSGVTNTYTGTTTIGNNSTLTVSGAGKLGSGSGAYAGAISIGTGGTLDYISTTYQTLSGVISGGGSVTLNSPVLTASPFNLTLSGTANTFSGGVTILDGILVANADLSLGAAPGSYNASYITLNGPSGTPYTAGLRTGSFTVNANRGIYLGANGGSIHCGSGSTLTYAGIISGPGSFWSGESVTVGYGTVKLSGANSYGGSTTVAAGTLQLGASGTLPSGTPVTIASDGSAGSVLDLNSFNQTIGPLSSSPGVGGTGTKTPTLKLSGALTINETSPTTFSGVISGTTGTLTLSASSTAALTLSGVNTFTGPININAGALTIGGPGGKLSSASTVNILNNGTFNFNSPVSQTLAGVISGSGPLIVNPGLAGGCILTLSGVNTYSGATTIANDGQVVISSESPTGGSLGTPPGSTVANQLTLNYGFLQVLNTMTLDVHRGITLGAGQIFNGAALGGAIFVDSGALTIPGVITGPSGIIFGGGTAQYGPGTVLLTGQNTYAGETGISTGTLQLGANGALPAGTPLIMAPDNYSGPTFDMNSVSQTIGPLSTIPLFAGPAGSGTPTILLSGPLTIIETSSTGFNGVINGSGGSLTLAAASTGTLTLSNANSYDGLTTISGGILEGNAAGSIPGNVTVNTGGKLQLDNINAMSSGATLTLPSSPAAGTVNLNLSGGTQTISALYFGATQQAIGTWGANGSGATYQNLAFTGSGILNVTTGPAITYSHTNYLQSITSNGGGSYTISALGTPGASYYLTYSANVQAPLSTWTPVPGSTNIAGGGGALSFTANNTPPAFYDVVAINPAP